MINALVVDDEKMTRDVLLKYIPWNDLGIDTVAGAEDGMDALSVASSVNPHIVLTDIRMPKMDGITLAAKLKERFPMCRVIFLSGYSDKEYLKSAIKLKAVSYVEKPIDLEEIRLAIQAAVSELESEKTLNSGNIFFIKRKLCLELIDARTNEKAVQEIKTGGFFPTEGKYACHVIKIYQKDMDELSDTLFVTTQIMKRLNNTLHHQDICCLSSIKGDSHIVVIVHVNSMDVYSDFIQMLENFCMAEADQLAGTRIFAGIGPIVDDISLIPDSYRRAVAILQKSFYRSHSGLIEYHHDNSEVYTLDESLLQQLNEALLAKQKDKAVLIIKRIGCDIKKHENTPPDQIRNIYYKIILMLYRIAEDRNIRIFKDECRFVLDLVTKANSYMEVENSIIELFSSLFDNNFNREESDMVEKITAYINENYYRYDLSISTIAKNLFISPSYLCVLYKKETGKTINQYITSVRIQKAKIYLKDPSVKIYEVANKVGFKDSKYFSKVFETAVGMKPKKYREIHCNG